MALEQILSLSVWYFPYVKMEMVFLVPATKGCCENWRKYCAQIFFFFGDSCHPGLDKYGEWTVISPSKCSGQKFFQCNADTKHTQESRDPLQGSIETNTFYLFSHSFIHHTLIECLVYCLVESKFLFIRSLQSSRNKPSAQMAIKQDRMREGLKVQKNC